jgi:hypothetical protein
MLNKTKGNRRGCWAMKKKGDWKDGIFSVHTRKKNFTQTEDNILCYLEKYCNGSIRNREGRLDFSSFRLWSSGGPLWT